MIPALEFTSKAPEDQTIAIVIEALERGGIRVLGQRRWDWGVEFAVRFEGRNLLLGLGQVEGEAERFRAFTKPPSLLDLLFGKAQRRARLLSRLQETLARAPEIGEVRRISALGDGAT